MNIPVSIPNLNNKLACDMFLHLAPPFTKKYYSEIIGVTYECKNGKELMNLELIDYRSVMVKDVSSAITIPCAGMKAIDFIMDYMEKNRCTDIDTLGIYYFKVLKREKINANN